MWGHVFLVPCADGQRFVGLMARSKCKNQLARCLRCSSSIDCDRDKAIKDAIFGDYMSSDGLLGWKELGGAEVDCRSFGVSTCEETGACLAFAQFGWRLDFFSQVVKLFVMGELAWRLVDAEPWYQEVQLERLAPVNTPRSLTANGNKWCWIIGVCLWRVDDCWKKWTGYIWILFVVTKIWEDDWRFWAQDPVLPNFRAEMWQTFSPNCWRHHFWEEVIWRSHLSHILTTPHEDFFDFCILN